MKFQDIGLNPEGGIIGKFDILVRIKFFNRLHQADIALLNQVQQVLHPYPLKLQCDFHHQTQDLRSPVIGSVLVALLLHPLSQLDLFFPGQQVVLADLRKIALKRIVFDNGFVAGASAYPRSAFFL
jgi:hypothetical protein